MNKIISDTEHKGRCECGSVQYTVAGLLRDVVNCHCKQCQRTHGHFAAYTATETRNITFVNEHGLKWYTSSDHARRGFCQKCGASLFWQPLDKDYTCIAAGTLDTPTGLVTVRHIFIADAGDYYHLNDDLEKFPGSMMNDNSME